MNWMEFVSSIVKSIIWPIAITIIIIMLKNPVSNLISTLAKIKYKDWEFEFVINKKLDSITEQISEKQSEDTDGRVDNLTPVTNMSNKSFVEFDKNIRKFTNRYKDNVSQIKKSISFLNETIDDLYKKTVTKEELKNISTLEKIDQLISKGNLTKDHKRIYLEMVTLSNDIYFTANLHTVEKFITNISLFAEKIKTIQVEKKPES
ncbi:hypothetical protein P9248_10955 [Bacillus subtilis]|nr:hypothetical protein [Bacillus subtilis]